MATPLSDAEFEIVRKHVEQFPEATRCPICKNDAFDCIGIETAMPILDGSPSLRGQFFATVVMVCNRCFYVRHFAWLGVQKALRDRTVRGG